MSSKAERRREDLVEGIINREYANELRVQARTLRSRATAMIGAAASMASFEFAPMDTWAHVGLGVVSALVGARGVHNGMDAREVSQDAQTETLELIAKRVQLALQDQIDDLQSPTYTPTSTEATDPYKADL